MTWFGKLALTTQQIKRSQQNSTSRRLMRFRELMYIPRHDYGAQSSGFQQCPADGLASQSDGLGRACSLKGRRLQGCCFIPMIVDLWSQAVRPSKVS
ncbi:hypothetical protein BRADI_3g05873v3 [Brachypodium distachyon]|uniref:Uncharacterized protein n=1 Tax=Brachypodium distachyon TaxID=15368 RepID=A0A2K2CVF9_BRADI|nr:hypothetical protein BRADI_3g05873v3 [Brachypodium distachyon]